MLNLKEIGKKFTLEKLTFLSEFNIIFNFFLIRPSVFYKL